MPNITLVIQWWATCDMCTLWQRFGRGARDPNCEAIALWLVEPMYFDETKEEKAARKAKKEEKAKNKRKAREELAGQPASKKTRSDGTSRTVGATISTPLSDLTARFIASPPRPRVQPVPVSTVAESTAAVSINQSSTTANAPEPDSDADSDAESEADNTETLEERRQAYRKDKVVVSTKKTRKRKDGNELSPEMDDMINAGAQHRCIKCFRVPGRLYFGSDRTGVFFYLVVSRANFLSSFRP
jgi:ATP-dependent DNA helicase RecQ